MVEYGWAYDDDLDTARELSLRSQGRHVRWATDSRGVSFPWTKNQPAGLRTRHAQKE